MPQNVLSKIETFLKMRQIYKRDSSNELFEISWVNNRIININEDEYKTYKKNAILVTAEKEVNEKRINSQDFHYHN